MILQYRQAKATTGTKGYVENTNIYLTNFKGFVFCLTLSVAVNRNNFCYKRFPLPKSKYNNLVLLLVLVC